MSENALNNQKNLNNTTKIIIVICWYVTNTIVVYNRMPLNRIFSWESIAINAEVINIRALFIHSYYYYTYINSKTFVYVERSQRARDSA